MHRPKRWTIAPPHAGAADLAVRLRASPLLAQVLLNRGLTDPAACLEFLRPTPRGLIEPGRIPNLLVAAERIAKAIRDGQKIVIYGDYDVDGITATSILWHAIRQLGGTRVEYYIPHRIDEGYGLNAEALAQLCDGGAQLIISVDCGITAIEQAKVCRERGVDLIISDHHDWHTAPKDEGGRMKDEEAEGAASSASALHPSSFIPHPSGVPHPSVPLLPDCYAIVHPRLPGSGYANPHLCGAGVALKLAWGTGLVMAGGSAGAANGSAAARVSAEFREFLVEATALAALGTIADVVPLVGENRVIAHWGLGGLKASKLQGIQALIASANLVGQKLDSYHVGFLLAPRLNACGRMGHAREAVEMLTRADADRANEIAAYLEKQNRDRQALERRILEQALEQVAANGYDNDECRAVVLAGEGWHPGVIGIVASRIVDRLHRPTIMVATADGQGQGSGRSIRGFHLSRALEACRDHLDAFGGHEMAAGLKVRADRIPEFREAFEAHARAVLCPGDMVPELRLEGLAELNAISQALVRELKRLGPFGHGNPKPLLCCEGVTLAADPRRVGRTGDHVQLYVRQGEAAMKCIAFNAPHLAETLRRGMRLDLAVEPQINEYQGQTSVELEIKDVRVEE